MPHTQVGYLDSEWKHRTERPEIFSTTTRRANTSYRDVVVRDARPQSEQGALDLDTTGFVLERHETSVTDFRDPEQLERIYIPEMSELLRGLTGAAETFLHMFSPLRSENPDSFLGAYSLYMHCDWADSLEERITRDLLREHGSPLADDSEGWEFAWYNLWRPIDHEVQTRPLVLVDARTVDPADILEYYPAPGSIASLPVFSEEQRLHYFPRMQTDEVVIFKQLDSRRDRARVCPHTSFDDPESPREALPRRSYEIRLLCAFAP